MEEIADAEERSRLFHDYVCVKFGLNEKTETTGKSKSAYSYVNLLRAWGADSNRQAGAVLKAWVESRFGILATYHNGRLADDAAAREAFLLDRMRGAAKSIGVLMQLDLLYTFCQDELAPPFSGRTLQDALSRHARPRGIRHSRSEQAGGNQSGAPCWCS